ncbi:penicillin-binding protein [Ignavigranum ruoffiae]|uniref:transglycosylase domain-containing protein n=1 Tax=Ignavigranum ruoffiae TaxID=89093 RepID=UPI00204F8E68|nr:PBP1A family penicillin-binding protein [Ignavigranum ruoffiae]UPQ85586.1 penicillin-binding protein [Ignavigranum ruoffiae]
MVTGSRVERKKYEKNHRRPGKQRGHRILKKILIVLISLAFIVILAGAGLFGYYAMNAPEISKEELRGQVASKIFDRQGQLIKELGSQKRDLLESSEIPQVLKDSVLAIEDARFYSHKGVDPIRIIGALLANIRQGDIVQGGSTITQQLVKLSVFSTDFQDQTLERKAQEAWLSLQIEQDYSKDEILTLYLNKLFYSNNTYGAKTAAKLFFGKDIQDINLAEAALLAGIPQAPSDYDPYSHPQAAQERRDTVLAVMLDRDFISQAEYDQAVATDVSAMLVPLAEQNRDKVDYVIDAYLDVVAKEVQDKMNINIYTDGVEVYTNMNYQAQEHLYDYVNQENGVFPDDKLQTAVSIIDVDTGELQAVIGGRKQDVTMGLNRANTLSRSIGSTMKPLADYGPAFEYLGFSTGTLVVDEPYTYTSGDALYNYDFEYKGNMTLREALASSRNIPALKTLQAVGLDNSYAFLQKLDINLLNNNRKELVEANAIGGEVNPIQLSAAYAAIADYGQYHQPFTVKKVVTGAGTVEEFESKARQAMKDSTAYMLIDILKGVPGNFASRSGIDNFYHAGKTGTTNYTDQQLKELGVEPGTYAAPDGWYVGFSPQYAIASWVGYDNPLEAGNYLSLNETAIPQDIYKEMMTFLSKDVTNVDWQKPDSVVEVEIEKYTDPIMLPGPYTPAQARSKELFLKGKEPKEQSLAYGKFVNPPTGFDANYDQEKKTIQAVWDPLTGPGQFELSINGVVVYTGTDTSFTFPVEELGTYVLRLRIIDGNSSSDTLVITLTLKDDQSEESSDESEDETSTADETDSSSQSETTNSIEPNADILNNFSDPQ